MVKEIDDVLKDLSRILDLWLPHKIKYDHIPGISVGIVHKGRLIYKKGFGYSDISGKKKATPETNYRIASISKPFTAIAILQLVEQGKLSLNDPIFKHLPWFKAKNKKGDSKNITIKQILSHRSGVFRDGNTHHWETDKFPNENGLRESVSNDTLALKNLTRFKYSNFGFSLLGAIIEKVSGMTYGEYVEKNIIRRLGMENTAPDLNNKSIKLLAKGYSRQIPGENMGVFKHSRVNAYAPAAGFISNVVDLAKFLPSLSVKNKNLILSNKLKKKMVEVKRKTNYDGYSYGFGLLIKKISKRELIGHSGGFPGFITQIALDDKNDIGVIVLSNRSNSSACVINYGIFKTIYNLIDNKELYKKGGNNIGLKKYEGVYRNRWADLAILNIGNKLLCFDVSSNSPMKDKTLLRPIKGNKFIIESQNSFDDIGEVVRFSSGKMFWGAGYFKKIS